MFILLLSLIFVFIAFINLLPLSHYFLFLLTFDLLFLFHTLVFPPSPSFPSTLSSLPHLSSFPCCTLESIFFSPLLSYSYPFLLPLSLCPICQAFSSPSLPFWSATACNNADDTLIKGRFGSPFGPESIPFLCSASLRSFVFVVFSVCLIYLYSTKSF